MFGCIFCVCFFVFFFFKQKTAYEMRISDWSSDVCSSDLFNDELNSVWRDLFVRLAPEEPFIPAFAIPESVGADIEAVLETHHRRGGKGGNPRAMLSAGNLNTAALTLFLALHLSVKPQLPWIVIDEPVQRQDEVHNAKFAAPLPTLSPQMMVPDHTPVSDTST